MLKNTKRLFQMLWKENKLYFFISFAGIIAEISANICNVIFPKVLIEFLTGNQIQNAVILAIIFCIINMLINMILIVTNGGKSVIQKKFRLKLDVLLAKKANSILYQRFENFKEREEYQFAVKCANEGVIETIMNYAVRAIGIVASLISLMYITSYTVWWIWIVLIITIIVNIICEKYRIEYNFESYRAQNEVEFRMLYARDRLPWKHFAKEVRLFQMYDYVVEKANYFIDMLSSIQTERANKTFRALAISYIVHGIQILLVYSYVGYQCYIGTFSIGEFTVLTLAILSVSQLTSNLVSEFLSVKEQAQYLNSYFSFLDKEEMNQNVTLDRTSDFSIRFEGVTFSYSDNSKPALEHISYTFDSGKKYGIVGANGSGKTTFINLLMGLYYPTAGKLYWNNQLVNDINPEQYYACFSPVLQDFNIYAYTIAENISMSEIVDKEKLDKVLSKMNVDWFYKLKKKENTYITTEYEQEGTEFSGGEMQKLAIMRALYKDALIWVLDEPTSALSPKSEYELYQEINRCAKEKTVFFISHRLASCHLCDEILVFDNGSLVESGSHEMLMKKKGLYYTMFSAQASLYAEEKNEEEK